MVRRGRRILSNRRPKIVKLIELTIDLKDFSMFFLTLFDSLYYFICFSSGFCRCLNQRPRTLSWLWSVYFDHYIPGVNFINVLRADFTLTDPKIAKRSSARRSQKRKKLLFALLGSASVKAARRMLVKLTPGHLTNPLKTLMEHNVTFLRLTIWLRIFRQTNSFKYDRHRLYKHFLHAIYTYSKSGPSQDCFLCPM